MLSEGHLTAMKFTHFLCTALLLAPLIALHAAEAAPSDKMLPRAGQRVVDLPLRSQEWPSQPPKDCPFEQSKTLAGIVFTSDSRTQWRLFLRQRLESSTIHP
jgi:hypothetical protein